MQDRIPQNPGRVLITPENGGAPFYATITRADNPLEVGTPLNKATLLSDELIEGLLTSLGITIPSLYLKHLTINKANVKSDFEKFLFEEDFFMSI
ncbi:MAG: hypothetical protein PHE51_01030 [Eubacteriales bacterium]|nr:hypothetical protein [Eubacteriales bacterium]